MNKRRIMSACVLTGLVLLGGCNIPAPNQELGIFNRIYQVGSLQALAKGGYDGAVTLGELPYGNIGIGTYNGLDGEMVMLDGVYYRIPTEGHVAVMKPTDKTPFCNVACAGDGHTYQLEPFDTLAELKTQLRSKIHKHGPYTIRVEGTFTTIKTRSVPKQKKPYKPLLEVVKTEQVVFDLTKDGPVEGTILGFYFPESDLGMSFKGINVVGFHLHFITKDRSAGGHLLEASYAKKDNSMDFIEMTPNLAGMDFIGPKPEAMDFSEQELDVIEKHPGKGK